MLEGSLQTPSPFLQNLSFCICSLLSKSLVLALFAVNFFFTSVFISHLNPCIHFTCCGKDNLCHLLCSCKSPSICEYLYQCLVSVLCFAYISLFFLLHSHFCPILFQFLFHYCSFSLLLLFRLVTTALLQCTKRFCHLYSSPS